ncbi:MAG: hypothetical protein M3394_00400 [Actinomycetota bacterium]|nr:hypothetical protein [Actinomycetota bacterium]
MACVRKRAAAAAMVVVASVTAGCAQEANEANEMGCTMPVLTAEPGRVVEEAGARSIELVGHISYKGRGLPGAELSFSYNHLRADGTVMGFTTAERFTDASGTAVFRQSFEDFAMVSRISGTVQRNWRLGLESWFTLDDVDYCDTSTEAVLPLEQLPVE